jgi:hypothetical protein
MDFIKETYHNYSRITLCVDNAKWHKAKLVKEYLSSQLQNKLIRRPGESRGPEHIEKTGFRLSPE